jgi:hypothetical protein
MHLIDRAQPIACRQQGRLIQQIRQIGPGEASGLTRQLLQGYIRLKWLIAGMHFQNCLPTTNIWLIQHDASIKAART